MFVIAYRHKHIYFSRYKFSICHFVELISSTGAVTRASGITFNNATSLTVTTNLSVGSYFVRVENNDGGAVRSSSAILNAVSAVTNWSTGAGSLGTINGATQSFTLLAYDDDSTAVTSYSLQSGSLPGGFTLDGDSSVGTISGTETGSSATTAYSFAFVQRIMRDKQQIENLQLPVSRPFQEADNLTNNNMALIYKHTQKETEQILVHG